MEILYLGSLMLVYNPYKYKGFEKFYNLRKKIDLIFKLNIISLDKIPKKPTLENSNVYYSFILKYQSEEYYIFMSILEKLELKDLVFFRLEFKIVNY